MSRSCGRNWPKNCVRIQNTSPHGYGHDTISGMMTMNRSRMQKRGINQTCNRVPTSCCSTSACHGVKGRQPMMETSFSVASGVTRSVNLTREPIASASTLPESRWQLTSSRVANLGRRTRMAASSASVGARNGRNRLTTRSDMSDATIRNCRRWLSRSKHQRKSFVRRSL